MSAAREDPAGATDVLPALGLEALRAAITLAQMNRTGVMLSWETAAAIARGYELALAAPRAAGPAVGDEDVRYFVARKRDTDPWEVWSGDRAAMLPIYSRAQGQWTDTYLLRVVSGPGPELYDRALVGEGGRLDTAARAAAAPPEAAHG